MKIIIALLSGCLLLTNVKAQKMEEYKIEVDINASKKAVWKTIIDFEHYPQWNSVLNMENNDSLIVGNKFDVSIKKPNNKRSNFKAVTVSKDVHNSFAAKQKILGKWFFQATHFFIIKETDKDNITFIQKWELQGILASLFRKQIFKELEEFKKMNRELKVYVENKRVGTINQI